MNYKLKISTTYKVKLEGDVRSGKELSKIKYHLDRMSKKIKDSSHKLVIDLKDVVFMDSTSYAMVREYELNGAILKFKVGSHIKENYKLWLESKVTK